MRSTFAVVAIAFALVARVYAQGSPEETREAASKALGTFRELINAQNAKTMGFDSPTEVADAVLGDPMRVSLVRLDQLRDYQAGSDPAKLLVDINQVIYPLMIKDQPRSAIVLQQDKGVWKPVSYGGANVAKILGRVRKEHAEANKLPIASYSVVQVRALNLYFLGYRHDSQLMLIPALDDDRYGFKAGSALAAGDVFAKLAPIAKELKEDVPR